MYLFQLHEGSTRNGSNCGFWRLSWDIISKLTLGELQLVTWRGLIRGFECTCSSCTKALQLASAGKTPRRARYFILLIIRCILGDIRLWVGDPSSRRVERLFDIFLSCVPPPLYPTYVVCGLWAHNLHHAESEFPARLPFCPVYTQSTVCLFQLHEGFRWKDAQEGQVSISFDLVSSSTSLLLSA